VRKLALVKNKTHIKTIAAERVKHDTSDAGILKSAPTSMNLRVEPKRTPVAINTHSRETIEIIKPNGLIPSALRRKP
jgi:hypothetical protein